MSVSYAGVDLVAAPADLREWISLRIDPTHLWEWTYQQWPGPSLAGFPFKSPAPDRDVELDCLYWPAGASKFSIAHFLCDEGQLDSIRTAVYGSSNLTYAAGSLVMSDGYDSRTASMWMLPPRPLQFIGADGLFLLTLVDDRFWWWSNAASITCAGGTTSWTTLYSNIAAALSSPAAAGITLTVDTVSSNYLKPPSSLGTKYESLPLLLDAVAYCVGQRIVRQLDGTVRAWSVVNSGTNTTTQLAALPTDKSAGGNFQLGQTFSTTSTPKTGLDDPAVLPASVKVAFPNTVSSVLQAAPYTVVKTLTGLALADFSSLAGQTNLAKVFRANAIALEAGPTNAAELSALAGQIATDFYRYQAAQLNLSLIGFPSWTLDGLTGWAEYRATPGDFSLRLFRGVWNDDLEELLYYGTGGAASGLTRTVAGSNITIIETGDEKQSIGASGSAGSIIVEATDGSPSYPASSTLQFTEADGFVLSQPGANIARVGFTLPATITTAVTFTGLIVFTQPVTITNYLSLYYLREGATYVTWAADQNNYALPDVGTLFIKVNNVAGVVLTGIANGAHGRVLKIHVTENSTGLLGLAYEDAGSTATNRLVLPALDDVILRPGDGMTFVYDDHTISGSLISRWRCIDDWYPDADPTHVGYVNLEEQNLGTGHKIIGYGKHLCLAESQGRVGDLDNMAQLIVAGGFGFTTTLYNVGVNIGNINLSGVATSSIKFTLSGTVNGEVPSYCVVIGGVEYDGATTTVSGLVFKAGLYISGSVTPTTPTVITVANEVTDTTCFPAFFTAATGDLGPKTNANLTFDSSTGLLSALVPTASVNTNTTQVASTAFVVGQAGASTPAANSGSGTVGTSLRYSRDDHAHPAVTGFTSNTKTNYTGTTTNALVTVFTVTNSSGLHGSFSVKNTHASNGLSYKVTAVDMYGTSRNSGTVPVPVGNVAAFNFDSILSTTTAGSPNSSVTLEVIDTSGGSHATYDVYTSVVG